MYKKINVVKKTCILFYLLFVQECCSSLLLTDKLLHDFLIEDKSVSDKFLLNRKHCQSIKVILSDCISQESLHPLQSRKHLSDSAVVIGVVIMILRRMTVSVKVL